MKSLNRSNVTSRTCIPNPEYKSGDLSRYAEITPVTVQLAGMQPSDIQLDFLKRIQRSPGPQKVQPNLNDSPAFAPHEKNSITLYSMKTISWYPRDSFHF